MSKEIKMAAKLLLVLLLGLTLVNDAATGLRLPTEEKRLGLSSEVKALQESKTFEEVEKLYNRMANSMYAYRIRDLKEVKLTKRPGSVGLDYDIVAVMVASECKKDQSFVAEDLHNCKITNSATPQKCRFNAWFRPWLILGAPQPSKVTFKGCSQ